MASKRQTVLVLRTCSQDMTSRNNFRWPKRGRVEATDWRDDYRCGGGLHGLLWGVGDGEYLDWSADAKWLVVAVDQRDLRTGQGELTDKCKFCCGTVVYCGDRIGATSYLLRHGAAGMAVVGCISAAGDFGTATAGDRGTATAGHGGTATAGHWGTATAGDGGTATAGHWGTATAGHCGTATAGNRGAIVIRWWDCVRQRYRVAVGYVGEDGIEPGKPYVVRDGKLARKET